MTASDAFFTGEGFKIDIGSEAVWDITTHPRSMGHYNSSKSLIRYRTTNNTIR